MSLSDGILALIGSPMFPARQRTRISEHVVVPSPFLISRSTSSSLMLTEEELGVVDDWRIERRMPSRAAIIREVLQRGLGAKGFDLADRRVK